MQNEHDLSDTSALFERRLRDILAAYAQNVQFELSRRWELWPLELERNELHEVVGGLLARQVSLAIQLVGGPPIWNPEVAPLILRSMIELRISLGWILKDSDSRARKYIRYGLGQAKLILEHRKAWARDAGLDPEKDSGLAAIERWINAQRYHFLTEVSVGSWSDVDIRTMAQECGCEDLYRRSYVALSACVHNMWHHVGVYDLAPCTNPLHRGGHRVPHIREFDTDLMCARAAIGYVADTFAAFDEFRGTVPDCLSAATAIEEALSALGAETDPMDGGPRERNSQSDSPTE